MEPIRSTLHLENGAKLAALIHRVDLGGSEPELELSAIDDAPLRMGTILEFDLLELRAARTLSAAATLVFVRKEAGGLLLLRLRMTPDGALELGRQLHRRGSLHVVPALTAPMRVRVLDPVQARGTEVRVRDVSTNGMNLVVGEELDAALARAYQAKLSVRVPGCATTFEVPVEISCRMLAGGEIVHGVRFAEAPGDAGAAFEREIFAYVMHRQRELVA